MREIFFVKQSINMQANKTQFTLMELTKGLDVTIKGDPHCSIKGVSTLHHAQPGQISFLTNSLYRKHLANTHASAVILSNEDAAFCATTAIICSNPYYVYAKIAEFFLPSATQHPGIHPSAVMGIETQIDPTTSIGAHCVIGDRVRIAAGVSIGPGTIIGNDCVIGEASKLDARVTLYAKVTMGKRCHIASGVVMGSDGFGLANHQGQWHKVPQLGGVELGNDVDIGANTAIDGGAVENTIIEDGVKLDNLIQVAHNVKIGAHSVIAGCTGIAGSATIGKYCMIGGASMILGHITIADKVMITGGTGVSKSISESGMYSSGIIGVVPNHEFRKNNARFHRLENLINRVKTLEIELKALKKEKEE